MSSLPSTKEAALHPTLLRPPFHGGGGDDEDAVLSSSSSSSSLFATTEQTTLGEQQQKLPQSASAAPKEIFAASKTKKSAREGNTSAIDDTVSASGSEKQSLEAEGTATPAVTAVHHHSRLSKWAARLFDPDRPKGLVQAPQTIPLNDEFLQAFGRREREADSARGVTLEIDRTIADNDHDHDGSDNDDLYADATLVTTTTVSTPVKGGGKKVKITNLKYATTASTLEDACAKFGPVEYVNLLLQQQQPTATETTEVSPLNSGLAYVTFRDAASAQACVSGLGSVDHRRVTVVLVANTSAVANRNGPYGGAAARYWSQEDLTTKCFRCGKIGHRAAECPIAAEDAGTATGGMLKRPCPLCADTGHTMRTCPARTVCFHCGIAGHVSRECTAPRNLPLRRICTVCYQTFHHHKTQCPRSGGTMTTPPPPPSASSAICLTCGRTGHYLCSELKWFFGLEGVSCSNCGMPGHIGRFCNRINLDGCCRNEALVIQEIERAGAVSSVEESIIQANSTRSSSSTNHYNNNNVMTQQRRRQQDGRGYERGYSQQSQHQGGYQGGRAQQQQQGESGRHSQQQQQQEGDNERGRQPHRQQQRQQLRPFKSMPPPRVRGGQQPSIADNYSPPPPSARYNENKNHNDSRRPTPSPNNKRKRNR